MRTVERSPVWYGIRAKIVLISIAILLFSIGATTLAGVYVFNREYTEVLRAKALTTGRVLKYQIEKLLSLGIPPQDIVGFEEQCADVVARHGDIAYAMIADTRGRVLFHNDPARNGETLTDPPVLASLADAEEAVHLHMEGTERYYDITVPVFSPEGGHVGSVRIGVPERVVAGKTRRIWMYALAVAVVSFGLSACLLFYALSSWVCKPIDRFLAVISDIAGNKTDFSKRVAVGSKDEIGRLASAFNGMIGALEETTVSKDLLRVSEERYRSIVEHSLVGICILQGGTLRFVNRRFCDMIGYPCDELVDKIDPRTLIHPDDRETIESEIRRLASGEIESSEKDMRCVRRNGEAFPAKVLGILTLFDGRPAIVGSFLDMSKEKRLEEQLLQSQKMEAVGRLAGGLAHDINNYLVAVTASCELAMHSRRSDAELAAKMQSVIDISFKAAALIRQLLAFSRQQPANPQVIDPSAVLGGMEEMLRRLIREDVSLRMRLAGDPWTVRIDPIQLEQIVVNLVVNARDAMESGGSIEISNGNATFAEGAVRLPDEIEPGRYAFFAVTDSGKGIPPEIRHKIFEPFFSTKERTKGSGLGLATVYGIVKQNHGHIAVESKENAGTVFRIYLPACEKAVDVQMPRPQSRESGPSQRLKILLVEDNEQVRNVIAAYLSTMDYEVVVSPDGNDAVRRARECGGRFDLLITDVIMPGMNGMEVANRVRDLGKEVKVLFISGHSDDIIDSHGLLNEGLHFLQKPFSVVDLAKTIRELTVTTH